MLDDRIQDKYNKIYDRNTELGYILTKYLIKAEKASSVDTLDETIIDLFADVDSYYRLIICSMQDAIIKSNEKDLDALRRFAFTHTTPETKSWVWLNPDNSFEKVSSNDGEVYKRISNILAEHQSDLNKFYLNVDIHSFYSIFDYVAFYMDNTSDNEYTQNIMIWYKLMLDLLIALGHVDNKPKINRSIIEEICAERISPIDCGKKIDVYLVTENIIPDEKHLIDFDPMINLNPNIFHTSSPND